MNSVSLPLLAVFSLAVAACSGDAGPGSYQSAPLYVAAPGQFVGPVALALHVSEELDERTVELVLDAAAEWKRAIPFARIDATLVVASRANVKAAATANGQLARFEQSSGVLWLDAGQAADMCALSKITHELGHALGVLYDLDQWPGSELEQGADRFAVMRAFNACSTRVLEDDVSLLADFLNFRR